jgi:hypothetical protein
LENLHSKSTSRRYAQKQPQKKIHSKAAQAQKKICSKAAQAQKKICSKAAEETGKLIACTTHKKILISQCEHATHSLAVF